MKRYRLAGIFFFAIAVSNAFADSIAYSGVGVNYTISISGMYDITVAGAQGGAGTNNPGGLGALIDGDVFLTSGTVLEVVAGGQGASNTSLDYGGGGGGGSFVFVVGAANPLIVAGGGGGAGWEYGNGTGGQVTTSGTAGSGYHGGTAGTGDSGGGGGTFYTPGYEGGGGGGWSSNGTDGAGPGGFGDGGFGPTTFAGGGGNTNGGFGGGGGGGYSGGGGGGGYSGGGGGSGEDYPPDGGGGGGSYIDPSVTANTETGASNSGDGYVDIVEISAASAPEPGSFILIAMGLITLGLLRKRVFAKLHV